VVTVLTLIFLGYLLCLTGFSIFMANEARKFEDNQHTVKLLPPPQGWQPESHPTVSSEVNKSTKATATHTAGTPAIPYS